MFLDSILTFLLGLSCIMTGMSLSLEQLLVYINNYKADSWLKIIGKVCTYLSQVLIKISPILGIFAVVVGTVAFISPSANLVESGDKIIYQTSRFIGDLIPAFLSIVTGLMLNKKVLDIFNISKERVNSVESKLSKYRVVIGLLAVIFGFLHWIIGSSIIF